MKNILLLICITVLSIGLSSCQKPEENKPQKSAMPQGPIIDTSVNAKSHGSMGPKTGFQVVVPPEVKENWKAATFIVEDKKENTRNELTVNIGDNFNIPGSKMTVKAGPFLPDFKMSAATITSVSNKLNNPAIGVSISENGRKIFPPSGEWGWLYMNFPTIHSFQHERFGLVLKEGVAAKK